ncbi:MAG: MATE family efflux transporter [Planctomycetota bacterium]|nr:MATE family efflux transporter [Planctomycetota bacterium]MDP6988349.1 MATE family efflux transporter [Planctomycetota bacterium]
MSRPAPAGVGDVLRLAWPSILSFILHNGYRINDQYFVADLGPNAHAAIASSVFVLIMNFGVIFCLAGGVLPLVARATGAADPTARDATVRHALAGGLVLALCLTAVGTLATPKLAGLLAAGAEQERMVRAYLGTIFLLVTPLVLTPIVDSTFIGMGDTRTPMILQAFAVALNACMNPLLIYGAGSFEGLGIAGAAVASCTSRAFVMAAGLILLRARHGVRLRGGEPLGPGGVARIVRIGAPAGLSILMYAGVYWVLLVGVINPLGAAAIAGLGLGFNVFESISFPFILGIALAGASIVGRNLGAGDRAGALVAVRSVRRIARTAGASFCVLFWVVGPAVAPLFTDDPDVLRETVGYVTILAFSQWFVAEETVNEKILNGAGHTRPIFWISGAGNLLRIPLAWALSAPLGLGAAGVWWAINVSTALKALAFRHVVERRSWL